MGREFLFPSFQEAQVSATLKVNRVFSEIVAELACWVTK
jgi:hypothetical protein